MKITTNLTHIATEVEFEPALTEEQLKEAMWVRLVVIFI